jgi:hypothetical protein
MVTRILRLFLRLMLMAGAGIALFRTVIRPRIQNWGVVADEPVRTLPGDELIPDASEQSTSAITIHAPPAAVWPWLAQMGCTRAGWYSYDLLDNGGRPSADKIIPALQSIKENDLLLSTPDGEIGFTVLRMEPPHFLVLGRPIYADSGLPVEVPGVTTNVTWTFLLEPVGDGFTRLIVRTRAQSQPTRWMEWTVGSFWTLAHFIMQRRQLFGIKERVEEHRLPA